MVDSSFRFEGEKIMPMYDYLPKCKHLNTLIMSYKEFDAFESGTCSTCGKTFTSKDREISANIEARVLGVRKGNYNSNH